MHDLLSYVGRAILWFIREGDQGGAMYPGACCSGSPALLFLILGIYSPYTTSPIRLRSDAFPVLGHAWRESRGGGPGGLAVRLPM